jgi:hypothetical protein
MARRVAGVIVDYYSDGSWEEEERWVPPRLWTIRQARRLAAC